MDTWDRQLQRLLYMSVSGQCWHSLLCYIILSFLLLGFLEINLYDPRVCKDSQSGVKSRVIQIMFFETRQLWVLSSFCCQTNCFTFLKLNFLICSLYNTWHRYCLSIIRCVQNAWPWWTLTKLKSSLIWHVLEIYFHSL